MYRLNGIAVQAHGGCHTSACPSAELAQLMAACVCACASHFTHEAVLSSASGEALMSQSGKTARCSNNSSRLNLTAELDKRLSDPWRCR